MAWADQDFTNGNILNDSDLDTLHGNIVEVRRTHKGPVQPPSLAAGVRWLDDSGQLWVEKIYDGAQFIEIQRIDPVSDLIVPAETRRRNLVWNGAMDVWQDGTSEPGITSASFRMADGFVFSASNQGTWTVASTTAVPTPSQAGRHINFALLAQVTTADTVTNANDFAYIHYAVEGFDWQELYQQPLHLSFWVRASTPGTYCLALRNAGTDRSYVAEYTIDAPNTYELKQFAVREVPAGGTWNFENGIGLEIGFVLAAGGSFQTSPNAWQPGNFVATANQTNLAAAVNNSFYITDVRLHGGTARAAVIVPSFHETLKLAQRRFWKSFDYGTKPAQNAGSGGALVGVSSGTGPGTRTACVIFPCAMRTTPVMASFNTIAADANWSDGASVSFHTGDAGFSVRNGSVVGDMVGATVHVTADARF